MTDLGKRLADLDGRLRLLLLHLSSPGLRRRVQVEDLLQEVYLRALAGAGRLPAKSPGEVELLRYLRTIARHVVVDVVRAARAAKRDGRVVSLSRSDWSRAGVGVEEFADDTAGPLTRLEGAEESERLRMAFERLSPDHRRVLGLRKFEGLSAAEAGARLGRSEKAVHSLYRRALEAWEAALRQ